MRGMGHLKGVEDKRVGLMQAEEIVVHEIVNKYH